MADKKISQLTAASTPLTGVEVLPIVQTGSTVKVAVSDLTAGRSVSMSQLGVGTASPSYQVHSVQNGNLNATIGLTNSTAGASSLARFIAISDAGNVQLAMTSSSYTDISGAQDAALINANGASGGLVIAFDGTKKAAFSTAGSLVPIASQGVNFTANTPATGMTSQLLNWYEEGTWTPVYATTGNPYTSVTYGIQSGTYTRIGRMVSIKLRIRTSAVTIGSASGALIITGLPFTSAASGCPVTIGYADTFSTNAPINAEVNGSATSIALYYRATVGGSVASMQYNYLSTGAADNDLTIAGFYYV